jgi:hypothetical protein
VPLYATLHLPATARLRRCVCLVAFALLLTPTGSVGGGSSLVSGLRVTNGVGSGGGTSTTISPDGDGFRDTATLEFSLSGPATVRVYIESLRYHGEVVLDRRFSLPAGRNTIVWRPSAGIPPRTYVVRLTVPGQRSASPIVAPVVRVLGIEAAFGRESYRAQSLALLRVATDQTDLALQFFRVSAFRSSLDALGEPVSNPVAITTRRGRRSTLRVRIGDWPTGFYFARLTDGSGRFGYAPFVLRPRVLGENRVAVVLPTYTWQAYNFRDANRDGVGDTWYARAGNRVLLGRPYLDRGVPPFFRRYDLAFLRWLARGDRAVDMLSDADLAAAPSPAHLAAAYDLLVFPGHHEYVTRREFDLVRDFRDRGGNLAFLSANNFFWRVDVRGRALVRVRRWRDLQRPEASLLGVQYLAGDHGERQAPFVVRKSAHAGWLFAGTGLRPGSRFGHFGIEIDVVTPASPPQTRVVAEIPNALGRGLTAQMTYYESRAGAKVFSAGAFTLGGHANYEPVATILDNLYRRLANP